jgi:hypothetical protein
MREFINQHFFNFLLAGACTTLAGHALKHQSHPGAALWMLCFVLVVYLREMLRLTQEHNEDYKRLAREQIDDNKEYSDYCKNMAQEAEKKDAAYQRDVLHNVYDSEKGKWTVTSND